MMHKIQRRFAHRWQCIEADQQVHKKGKNGKGIQLHQVDKNEKKEKRKNYPDKKTQRGIQREGGERTRFTRTKKSNAITST